MSKNISLYSGLREELHGLKLFRESIKLKVRALLHARETVQWLDLLNSHPLFGQILSHDTRFVSKIYRNYLSMQLSCVDRLNVLQTHYAIVMFKGLAPLVARAAAGSIEICQLKSKEGRYTIEVSVGGRLRAEGELIFSLMHDDELVYSVTSVFLRRNSNLMLGIGCLQGVAGGLYIVRAATRALYGFRPKSFLMQIVRQFGYDFGCVNLLLVGNTNRVAIKSLRQGRVYADYDALWREFGARQLIDGDFELRCEPLQKLDLTDVASKRRSEARKRHEMLATALVEIRQALVRNPVDGAAPLSGDKRKSAYAQDLNLGSIA